MSSKIPEKWDMEAEVVVVGYGAAGTAAAKPSTAANTIPRVVPSHGRGTAKRVSYPSTTG